jgi:F0F1-type ATP synthase assembly protein I
MQGLGKEIGDSITLGFELVLPTLFGAFIGYYIDQRIGTFPVALIIGLFIGAAAGFWNVARKFLSEDNLKKRDDQ